MTESPTDKPALLASIDREWSRLQAAAAKLGPARLSEPLLHDGWSVKDTLAHIAAWDRVFLSWCAAYARGEKPDRPDVIDEAWTDTMNARFYEEHRDRSLAEVVAESGAAHEAMLRFVGALSEADLFDPQRFPATQGQPFVNSVRGNGDQHYAGHIPEIEALAAKPA